MLRNTTIQEFQRIISSPLSSSVIEDPDNPNNQLVTLELPSSDSIGTRQVTFSMPYLRLEESSSQEEHDPILYPSHRRVAISLPIRNEILLTSDDDEDFGFERISISFDAEKFFSSTRNQDSATLIKQNSAKVFGMLVSHYESYMERCTVIEKLLRTFEAVKEKKIHININYIDDVSEVDLLSLILFHEYVELIDIILSMEIVVSAEHIDIAKSKAIGQDYIQKLESKSLTASSQENLVEILGGGNFKDVDSD
jgi:hypothetical protein